MARDWYWDPVSGSDGNDGAPANPLKLLQTAVNAAAAGDRVVMRRAPGIEAPGARWDKPLRVVADGDNQDDFTIVPRQGMIDGLRSDLPPNFKTDLPSLIQGFRVKNAPHAGIFVVNTPQVQVLSNKVLDSGAWGVHVGSSDGAWVVGNRIERVREQHGIYVCNSMGGDWKVTDNTIARIWCIAIHINGDLDTSLKIGLLNPSGYMKGGLVANNLMFDIAVSRLYPPQPGEHFGGGYIDADSCDGTVYRGNRGWKNNGWGINVDSSQGNPCRGVVLDKNYLECLWCLNVGPGSAGVVVTNNTLVSPSGSFKDDQSNGGLVTYTGNQELKAGPPLPAELLLLSQTADPIPDPPPLPPPPPPPPPPALPPFPAEVPTASPVVDLTRYDLTKRGVLCLEYDSKTIGLFGGVPKYQSIQPPPDDWWGSGHGTPVGGLAQPNYAMEFDGVYTPDFTGPAEFHMEGQGQVFGEVAGESVLSGQTFGGQKPVEGVTFLQVEKGKKYRIWGAFVGNAGDTVCSLRWHVRVPGGQRFALEALDCYPALPTGPITPVPVPPGPVGPPPPPPPPGDGVLTLTRDELLAVLKAR